jgi:hypothetical protein
MNEHRIRQFITLVAIAIAMLAGSTARSGFTARARDAAAGQWRLITQTKDDADSKTQKPKKDKTDQTDKANKKKEKRTVLNADEIKGQPVLWHDPGDIARRDLFYGFGGKQNAPDLSAKFTFMGRDKSGTSEKIYVNDSTGKEWIVKFGPEARPETAATRIVWAVGYHVDRDYFVRSVHIEGRGGFEARNVRFKLRHAGFKEEGLWKWEVNPFLGTRELDGLKVLMALLNNWDLKYSNNKIARPDKKSGEHDEALFYVADLGATFGTTGAIARKLLPFGDPPAGSKGDPAGYSKQPFIDGVKNGTVRFHYKGKDPSALQGVSVANARWMGNLLGQLSDKQLSDAFRAAGWDDADVAMLTHVVRGRIQQLQDLR